MNQIGKAIGKIFKKEEPPPSPQPQPVFKRTSPRILRKREREEKRDLRRRQGPFDLNAMFEGEHGKSYKITKVVRNPGPHAQYYVQLGDRDEYFLRLGRKGRNKMHHMAEILKAQKDACKESKNTFFLEVVEVGSTPKHDYLITTPRPGLEIYEIVQRHVIVSRPALSYTGTFTAPTVLTNLNYGSKINIALGTLECIRALHTAGYISRNVKLASFSIGYGEQMTVLFCMSDFRIARKHLDDATGEPRAPRERVRFTGTLRYASRAAMREKDQGRKDDLESWFYMFVDLLSSTLPWRGLTNRQEVLVMKDAFCDGPTNGVLSSTYLIMRDLIISLAYETKPDYDKIIEIFEIVRINKNIRPNMFQWRYEFRDEWKFRKALDAATVRSRDNLCIIDDEDDNSEFSIRRKPKPERAERRKLTKNDKFQSGTHVWTGNRLLQTGTWGDVYEVYDANEPPLDYGGKTFNGKRHMVCQIKIENEANQKSCHRLTTEMKVYMAIQKAPITSENGPISPINKRRHGRYAPQLEFFPQLMDSGRSVELKSRFIVTKFVGLTLEHYRKMLRVDLGVKDIPFHIATQTLEAIRKLHTIGFIHRNIKPSSFSINYDKRAGFMFVYMIDFGRCKAFDDRKVKEHRTSRSGKKVKLVGSLRFASRDCMRCLEHSRQDDLESWLYMVFDIFDEQNGLPWKLCEDRDVILAQKVAFFKDKLKNVYENVPEKMKTIVKLIDTLDCLTPPDYKLIQKELKTVAYENGYDLDDRKAFYIGKTIDIKEEGMDDGSVSEDEETIEANVTD